MITGKVIKFGDNIDTDVILPGPYLVHTDPNELAKHAMEGLDPKFPEKASGGVIVVGAKNFGCGSSREQAPYALKVRQVGAILAESFARIFYRNAINLGLPVLICPDISQQVIEGDVLTVDFASGRGVNERTGREFQAEPLSGYAIKIIESGGIAALIKEEYGGD